MRAVPRSPRWQLHSNALPLYEGKMHSLGRDLRAVQLENCHFSMRGRTNEHWGFMDESSHRGAAS